MASESPNPYAPSAVVNDEAQGPAGRPSRWWAVLVTVVCFYPCAGLGLYLLGRRRRFVMWAMSSGAAFALSIAGGLLARPALFTGGLTAMVALALVSLVDTLVVRPAESAPSLARALVLAGLVFAGERAGLYAVKSVLVETFKMPSDAMAPSLLVGDHLLADRWRPRLDRGAVIVHRYPRDPGLTYVKRIVALGGDTVAIRNGRVLINGVELPVQVTGEHCPRSPDRERFADCQVLRETNDRRSYTVMVEGAPVESFGPVTVPSGSVFVLGDNRNNSRDSRTWGHLPTDDVVGTVRFVYWTAAGMGDERQNTKP